MEKGQVIQLTIEDISNEGKGIGRHEGMIVFVGGATYGDTVKAEITKVKKHFAIAKSLEILDSKYRLPKEEQCPYIDECGGCPLGMLTYEAQLELKSKQVKDKLSRIGGLDDPKITGIVTSPKTVEYRNKAVFQVSTGGIITRKGGIVVPAEEAKVGFYSSKTHKVVDCQYCQIQSPAANAASRALKQFMIEDNITSYDPKWDKGLLRNMVVKTSEHTGDVMVILVATSKGIPNVAKLVEMLDDAIYEAGYSFTSLAVNVNKEKSLSGPIYGKETVIVAGRDTISDELMGLEFEISPMAFYQVNPLQTENLYGKAIEYAGLQGGETLLDLYCGVGTIGLIAAKNMKDGGKVFGIESIKGAVLDANRNATINGIVNARYVCGKAEDELPFMMGRKKLMKYDEVNELVERVCDKDLEITSADIAILDPPRAGCDEELLDAVVAAEVNRIVYVSCDPGTLARDIGYLREKGYEYEEGTCYDMFPGSGHCEVIASLKRLK